VTDTGAPSAPPDPPAAWSALPADLQAFGRAVTDEPTARVTLERLRELFRMAGPSAHDDPDPRRALGRALEALAAAGVARPPSTRSKHLWEGTREPALPLHVTRAPTAPPRPRRPADPPLHPALARARDRAPGVRLPDGIAEANAWLERAGLAPEVVPVAERSYEIFGDEKRLDAFLRTQFALEGGLGAGTFHALRVADPFVAAEVDLSSAWAIAVENLATWDSVVQAAAGLPPTADKPAAVIFGRGRQFDVSCLSLPERLPGVRRLVYFGDLDEAGLAIPLAVRVHLPTLIVEPWAPAYAALLECRPNPRPVDPVPPDRAERLVGFLPPALRSAAYTLLTSGRRIPQEAVGRTALARLLAADVTHRSR
jgi:hypothetical protein